MPNWQVEQLGPVEGGEQPRHVPSTGEHVALLLWQLQTWQVGTVEGADASP